MYSLSEFKFDIDISEQNLTKERGLNKVQNWLHRIVD